MKLDGYPPLLTLPELAVLLRRKVGGIRKQLQAGTFVPKEFGKRPYVWRREDVEAWLSSRDERAERRLRRAG